MSTIIEALEAIQRQVESEITDAGNALGNAKTAAFNPRTKAPKPPPPERHISEPDKLRLGERDYEYTARAFKELTIQENRVKALEIVSGSIRNAIQWMETADQARIEADVTEGLYGLETFQ